MRHRIWLRRLRTLVLPACALALALPAGAPAAPTQELRSPDARDAARVASQAEVQRQPGPARATRTDESTSSDDDTLAIALSSAAFGMALAGLAVALGALVRRPRSRWSAS